MYGCSIVLTQSLKLLLRAVMKEKQLDACNMMVNDGGKRRWVCPEDKSKCDCLTTCPTELAEDCPDRCNPEKCCQGCMASEEENEGG